MNPSDLARQAEEAEAADKFILSMDRFAPTAGSIVLALCTEER
jgi:hypothetical protein